MPPFVQNCRRIPRFETEEEIPLNEQSKDRRERRTAGRFDTEGKLPGQLPLDLETDVDLIQIRSPANLLTAFQTDQLEAVVLMSGYAAEAISSGGIVVTTMADAGGRSSAIPPIQRLWCWANTSWRGKGSSRNSSGLRGR